MLRENNLYFNNCAPAGNANSNVITIEALIDRLVVPIPNLLDKNDFTEQINHSCADSRAGLAGAQEGLPSNMPYK